MASRNIVFKYITLCQPCSSLCTSHRYLIYSLRGRRVKNQYGAEKIKKARGRETRDGESTASRVFLSRAYLALPIQWNPDFSNLQGKRKLVREMGSSRNRRWHQITLNRPFFSCGSVTRPMNGSEVASDFVLTQSSLLFLCKCRLVSITTTQFT